MYLEKIAANSHIFYYTKRHYQVTILLAVNNSVILDIIARLSKNKKLITYNCLYHIKIVTHPQIILHCGTI